MSVVRQFELLEPSPSTFYYRPFEQDASNLALMRRIDEEFTRRPSSGVARMRARLRALGHAVNPRRVMGLEAVYPKPRLAVNGPAHKLYSYLLKGVTFRRPAQAWAADIPSVRLAQGFIYPLGTLDWSSRYVVSRELSTALGKALRVSKPEIFNSNQRVQFTSLDFTGLFQEVGVKVSMNGRGRLDDNIFVERLWHSVKDEEVYLADYLTVPEARRGLSDYFVFSNAQRPPEAPG